MWDFTTVVDDYDTRRDLKFDGYNDTMIGEVRWSYDV